MKYLKLGSIFVFLNIMFCSFNTSADDKLNSFLDHLDLDSYVKLMEHQNSLCTVYGFTSNHYNETYRLFDKIEKGSYLAFMLGLDIEPCLDGGVRGDLYRSLGLFYEHAPVVYISSSFSKGWSLKKISKPLNALPLSLVDEFELQANRLLHRQKLARGLGNVIDKQILASLLDSLSESINLRINN